MVASQNYKNLADHVLKNKRLKDYKKKLKMISKEK